MIELRGDPVRKIRIRDLLVLKDRYPEVTFHFIYNRKLAESASYVKMLEKFCVALGMPFETHETVDYEKTADLLTSLQTKPGAMVIISRPLKIAGEERLLQLLEPAHDPDMLSGGNMARLLGGDLSRLPGTARSVVDLLGHYQVPIQGKRALVVGRSVSVGMPVFLALQRLGAFCSLAHSKVEPADLKAAARQSSLIVLASGQRGLLDPADIGPDCCVIDCGYHSDGRGDLGFVPDCAFFTPVPGGVGPLTIASVIDNGYALYRHGNEL